MHNVYYLETHMGRSGDLTTGSGWEKINRDRFQFFSAVCAPDLYSLCLTTDFRDSIFQSNPFANIDRLLLPSQESSLENTNATVPSGILHVFEHNKDMSQWHYQKMKEPQCDLYEQYGQVLKGANIINGGSIIGSSHAYRMIMEYMSDKWKGCNDQVILNILVRGNILTSSSNTTTGGDSIAGRSKSKTNTKGNPDSNMSIVVKVHRQGHGPMNVLGRGGMILKDKKGRLMNRNCIVSPTVHQYDLVVCPGGDNEGFP